MNQAPAVILRDMTESDLPILFEQQSDPDANWMAAFTAKDPTDREAYMAHWTKILRRDDVLNQIILYDGQVAGSVLSFEMFGQLSVAYWLGREYWGKGIATAALAAFLDEYQKTRPIYARVATDNLASRRVLEKCGFAVIGEDRGFANARGEEIDELILERRE